MGFILLTASLSWVLSIYPVLEYRRSAAHRLSLLYHAHRVERLGVSSIPEQETEQLVIALAVDMTKIRMTWHSFRSPTTFTKMIHNLLLPVRFHSPWTSLTVPTGANPGSP